MSATINEPGHPNAGFVEQAHGRAEREEGHRIGRGGDDGGQAEDDDEGVGPGLAHEFCANKSEENESEHEHRQFSGEAENQRDLGGKGEVFVDGPHRLPAHRVCVLKKECQGVGKDPEIAGEHAADEQSEAGGESGEDEFFLLAIEGGEDETGEEIEEQGKGENDARIEGEGERDGDGVGDAERLEIGREAFVDGVERGFEELDQPMAEGQGDGHGKAEGDGHFDEHPAEVFEVIEERFDGFAVAFAEFEEAF